MIRTRHLADIWLCVRQISKNDAWKKCDNTEPKPQLAITPLHINMCVRTYCIYTYIHSLCCCLIVISVKGRFLTAAMRGSAVSDNHPLTMRPLRAGEEPAPHLHGRQNCDSLWSVENRRQARPETACSASPEWNWSVLMRAGSRVGAGATAFSKKVSLTHFNNATRDRRRLMLSHWIRWHVRMLLDFIAVFRFAARVTRRQPRFETIQSIRTAALHTDRNHSVKMRARESDRRGTERPPYRNSCKAMYFSWGCNGWVFSRKSARTAARPRFNSPRVMDGYEKSAICLIGPVIRSRQAESWVKVGVRKVKRGQAVIYATWTNVPTISEVANQ